MNNWQPIETAPKDEQDILLFEAEGGEQFVGFSKGDGQYQYAYVPHGICVVCTPTHWQPLPAPPEPV
jgi:hypothetical protein